ncbi:MAG: cell division protein FtsL [Alphaproteobacteria bacterium]
MRVAPTYIALLPRHLVVPIAVAAMIGGATLTYQAKHDASEAAERVSQLRHEISQERIAISLLTAEWSELTQPGRLQGLIERNQNVLRLGPFGIDQMVHIRDIPLPPAGDDDLIADILTGAVR